MTTGRINQIAIHAASAPESRAPVGRRGPVNKDRPNPPHGVFSLSNFCLQNWVRSAETPFFYSKNGTSKRHTPQPWARHWLLAKTSSRPGSRLDRRSIAFAYETHNCDRAPLGTDVNQRINLPVDDSWLLVPACSQSWTLAAQSELPSASSSLFTGPHAPGSQVLRRWLCWLQWFLSEYQHNLPIPGTGLEDFFTAQEPSQECSFHDT